MKILLTSLPQDILEYIIIRWMQSGNVDNDISLLMSFFHIPVRQYYILELIGSVDDRFDPSFSQ